MRITTRAAAKDTHTALANGELACFPNPPSKELLCHCVCSCCCCCCRSATVVCAVLERETKSLFHLLLPFGQKNNVGVRDKSAPRCMMRINGEWFLSQLDTSVLWEKGNNNASSRDPCQKVYPLAYFANNNNGWRMKEFGHSQRSNNIKFELRFDHENSSTNKAVCVGHLCNFTLSTDIRWELLTIHQDQQDGSSFRREMNGWMGRCCCRRDPPQFDRWM